MKPLQVFYREKIISLTDSSISIMIAIISIIDAWRGSAFVIQSVIDIGRCLIDSDKIDMIE